MSALVIVAVEDLFFRARIEAVARALAIPVEVITDPGRLGSVAEFQGVLLDLEMPGDRALEFLDAIPADHRVVGYCSHVNAERMSQARERGCVAVSRSELTSRLAEVLSELVAGS